MMKSREKVDKNAASAFRQKCRQKCSVGFQPTQSKAKLHKRVSSLADIAAYLKPMGT
ncbi:MAG: hypothetical protein N3B10_01405 [Armatimonadetes bacterium]|nr:hypothetical protein [Armatimonadota bacterium]